MTRRIAIARLRVDRRGTSAIEFAMLAPVLLGIICGTIDLGYLYMAQTSLTSAVSFAARTNAVTQESSQAARDAAMRTAITERMGTYTPVPGGELQIISRVYNDFDAVKPEPYTDANTNGRYDAPSVDYPGDPFTDRNGNGRWDADDPIAGTTGDIGDVVRYTATIRIPHLFDFLPSWGGEPGVDLAATSVVRNEPVRTE